MYLSSSMFHKFLPRCEDAVNFTNAVLPRCEPPWKGCEPFVKPCNFIVKEPVVASRSNRFGQTNVAGDSEGTQVPDDTLEQGGEPGVTPNDEDESLDVKQKANEASFLDKIRQASLKDADLTRKGMRRRLIERDGWWWQATEGRQMALYIA